MNKKTIRDLDLKGKRVLMRVDFNVPIKDGKVSDDTRITAALPSIKYILDHGASVVLMSHLGRPKGGKIEPEFSLKPAGDRLAALIGKPVAFAPDCIGEQAKSMAKALKPGDILLLENTRFYKEEEGKAKLAELFLLFPVVFFIVPSVLFLLWGPAVLQLIDYFQNLGPITTGL